MNCLKYTHSDMIPEVYRGGGGFLGDLTEIATGGMVKSGKTKGALKAAADAQAKQAKLIKQQKAEIAEEEKMRKARVLKGRQGRRGLLYGGGDEAGVVGKVVSKLGG